MIVRRIVVSLESDALIAVEESEVDDEPRELSDAEAFYLEFWSEFIDKLRLDDVRQPFPNPTRVGNAFLRTPRGSRAWITLYFYQQWNQVGAYLTFDRSPVADHIYVQLQKEQKGIDRELGGEPDWKSEDGKHSVTVRRNFPDLKSEEFRDDIREWLSDCANRFVNTFRHRIERIMEEM